VVVALCFVRPSAGSNQEVDMKRFRWFAVTAVLLAGCGSSSGASSGESAAGVSLPQGGDAVRIDPSKFNVAITNPYWPMTPGVRWSYVERELDGSEATASTIVTNQTKVIANGVTVRLVRDTLTRDGQVIEDTIDYYAQDEAGNIWYFGEQTAEFDNGAVATTTGSFEAGVGGALGGIAVPAAPTAGMAYRQEFLRGEAEDNGAVLSTDELATVPAGSYRHVLLTKDTTPLEPDLLEYKLYAKGVGPVLVMTASGGSTRTELVSVDTAQPGAGTGPLGNP
jgi:hypothetical protein